MLESLFLEHCETRCEKALWAWGRRWKPANDYGMACGKVDKETINRLRLSTRDVEARWKDVGLVSGVVRTRDELPWLKAVEGQVVKSVNSPTSRFLSRGQYPPQRVATRTNPDDLKSELQ